MAIYRVRNGYILTQNHPTRVIKIGAGGEVELSKEEYELNKHKVEPVEPVKVISENEDKVVGIKPANKSKKKGKK